MRESIRKFLQATSISTLASISSAVCVALLVLPALVGVFLLILSERQRIDDARWSLFSSSVHSLVERYAERYDFAAIVELTNTFFENGTTPYIQVESRDGVDIVSRGTLNNFEAENIFSQDGASTILRIARPQDSLPLLGKRTIALVVAIPTLAILVFALVQYLVYNTLMVRPLRRLNTTAHDFQRGSWSPVEVEFGSEPIQVAQGFNELLAMTERHTRELEDMNEKILEWSEKDRKTQEELEQSRRLDAIGQLASGVSHDFNNMLAVVDGSLELIKLKLDAQEEGATLDDSTLKFLNENVEAALNASGNGRSIAQTVLGFARKSKISPTNFDLKLAAGKIAVFARKTVSSNIRVKSEFPDRNFPAYADRQMTENALLNLLVNAIDAMPNGGEITLEVRREKIDEEFEGITPGEYSVLSVSDTGVGISQEIQARVFEPYFSTKGQKGTGVGLAMIHGFAMQSGGGITVESTPGEGATFQLFLPVADPRETKVVDACAYGPRGTNKVLKILLVDDNEALQVINTRMLERKGHLVATASNGSEAWEVLESGACFDVVVTDIAMPGSIQGTELAMLIRENHTDLPVVFLTGEELDHIKNDFSLDRLVTFVPKPASLADLTASVAAVMEN